MSRITGSDDIQTRLTKVLFDLDKAADDAVLATANDVRRDAIKSIQEPSPSHTVKRQRQGGGTYSHQAANEGEAPNTDKGGLVKSIATEHEKGSKSAFVGTGLEYGPHLEFGFKLKGVIYGPWPWLEPAKEAEEKNYPVNVQKALQQQIEKAGR